MASISSTLRRVAPRRTLPGAIDDRPAATRPENQERILPQERIPRDLFASFDRLQQKRIVRVLGDLEEGRDRRQHVGDDLLVDRHERPALGQILEFVETRYVHRTFTNHRPRRHRDTEA